MTDEAKDSIEHSSSNNTEKPPADNDIGQDIPHWRKQLRYIPLIFLAIAIIIIIVIVVEDPPKLEGAEELKDYVKNKLGYLGVLTMGLAGSSVPIWPLPGSWAAFLAGGAGLNPALIGLAAGIGEPLGESTYYMAGYGGQAAVTNVKGYRKVVRWMERHGAITLFLVCAIPNFFTRAAVIAAGALRYPYWKFFLICWAGKTIKSIGFAIAGYYFFEATFDVVEWLVG